MGQLWQNDFEIQQVDFVDGVDYESSETENF